MGVPALAQSSDSSGSGLEKHNAAVDVAAQSWWSKDAPTLLAVNGEVAVAVAAQATPRQSSSRYSVRVGEAIEAPSMKLCGDLMGLWRLHWAAASLSRSCRMSRLLPRENLMPPIGVGDEDPPTAAEVLACRDSAIHWPRGHAAQQLWARPAALLLSLAGSLPAMVSPTTAHGC
jgi:hypothetical protein